MHIEELRNFCLSLANVEEKIPFDDKLLVFFVNSKIFCMTNVDTFEHITVKCNPYEIRQLKEEYEEIIGEYTMNKKHWISIKTDGKITNRQFEKWIKTSYELVVAALPKKIRDVKINCVKNNK